MKDILKALESKKDDKMDPTYKNAKLGVLDELKKLASGMLAGDVQGLKKVTVAAPDKEGLKMGLNKAEEVVEGGDKGMEMGEEVADPAEGMSPEEIDAIITALQAKKAKLSK